ncbi:mandelate racemase/muconate lactonizing enzyme family protein [Asanoa sp. NPDC049573]|uniref:mandelate racemase/muconate lactonizing enzyme family protein n=1 Tax=Asanoa sp. NPDC049573 TaxID=3155396 RepID=UPI00343AFA43
MKISELRTIRDPAVPSILFLEVLTDDGIVGLGETCLGTAAVEAHLFEAVAPKVLGTSPLELERISRELYDDFVGFSDSGVATRARSALDLALWDILGKVTGVPLYQLLGGRTRAAVPVYNSCAGPAYGMTDANVDRLGNLPADAASHPLDDLYASRHRPVELAGELLDAGITGMKVWPFDGLALAGEGRHIDWDRFHEDLRPLRQIHDAFGRRMKIMVDLHGLWRTPAVFDVVAALEEIEPYWIEDPVKVDSLDLLRRVAERTRVPIVAGETLATPWAFRTLIEEVPLGTVMFDIGWMGGLTEAKKVATLADVGGLTFSPHDCTGPVVFAAGIHLSVSATNALLQESVRAFYQGWYGDCVDGLPEVLDGAVSPTDRPGHGLHLSPAYLASDRVLVRSTEDR